MGMEWQLGRWLALPLMVSGFMPMKPHAATELGPANRGAPSFTQQIQPILDAHCVACHQTAGASGGLSLEEGAAPASIVGHKSLESGLLRVAPGKPEESYLMRKLEGTHVQAGGSGERMPPTGPLDPALVGAIRAWILAGARSD
jgi:hypothetical protein